MPVPMRPAPPTAISMRASLSENRPESYSLATPPMPSMML